MRVLVFAVALALVTATGCSIAKVAACTACAALSGSASGAFVDVASVM